jgi:D-alanyl-D-alanine carboxypeptidase/D-alanyl-D-alanine-endopeptidase (penicillin-binding protein 4)
MRSARRLLLGALAACAGCAGHAAGNGSANAPATNLPPVLNTRPAMAAVAPAPAWTDAQLRALRARLENTLGASALATSGIAIVDAAGTPLFMRREHVPYAPASTFKVLTAVAALETLGPDYRFETRFESIDDPHDGTLDGDLYLVGSGDPSLTSDDLRGGVAALARAGITRVTGGVVGDGTAFGGREVNPAWDPDDLQYDYAAGTSALSLDEGTVELHVTPGAAGAPATIDARPSGAVRVLGGVLTGYATDLSIDRAATSNTFTFGGSVAVDAEQSFYRPVIDQPLYAATVARTMLQSRNIAVEAPARAGLGPVAARVLWVHRSAPLRALLAHMLFESDNHYAEELLRAVGAHDGALGTEHAGALVERAILRRFGAPADGLHVVDGSGLAATDRIEPISIATLLARAALDPAGDVLIGDLPRVGIEGTVRRRDVTTALGRARAKSGHIADVNALVGYVQTHHHGRVSFAILVNDERADDGPVDDGIDAALDTLASE